MSRRIVMIGGWTDIYEKAKKIGFDLTVIQSKAELKGSDLPFIDQLITCEMDDPRVPELAAFLHGQRPFDAAVSFQELGIVNAAFIGDQLKLAANPLKPVKLTRNKGLMRAHMQRSKLPSIPFVVTSDARQIIDLGNTCGWPLILKPAASSGSRQIHKVLSADGVAPALSAIHSDFPGADPIAEKFVAGPEVSVEAFSWNGRHMILGVTDKITTGAPYFVEIGHNMPSALTPDIIERIKAMTLALLESIEHQHGPSHTEIIVSDDGPVIIESHTRTGGDRIFEMVELVCGVDMIKAMLEGLYCGDPSVSVKMLGGTAIRFLTLPEGIISAVAGLEQASASVGVVRCDIDLKVGTVIKLFRNSGERFGYVLATGATAQEAIDNVNAAMGKITITVQ